jgi:iduronate 2-sulfatase
VPAGLDGASLVPLLKGEAGPTKEAVLHVYPRGERLGRAVRTARYRLVEWKKIGDPAERADLELYDYESDPGETKNLAGEQPEVVAKLRALLARQPEARPQIRTAADPAQPGHPGKPGAKPQDRAALFARKDVNGDGKLSRQEFLANQPDPEQAKKRFAAWDVDGDGLLSRDEFIRMGGRGKP